MPPFADVLQWEHLPFPKSLKDFQRLFPDDTACARWLEGAKWPKGFECPHCHEKAEPVRLTTRRACSCAGPAVSNVGHGRHRHGADALAPDDLVLGGLPRFEHDAWHIGSAVATAGRAWPLRNRLPNLAQAARRHGPT